MARSAGTSVENNFRNGLITEATGFNFPENSCVSQDNCIFKHTGEVKRRLGFDFEGNYSTKTIDRSQKVINSYIWNNVSGDGTVILAVSQIGDTLYFYDASSTDPVSSRAISDNIDLTDFSPAGAPSPSTIRCQFADGNGKLFVVHPFLEAFSITYDIDTQTFETSSIDITIRDFEGLEDNLEIDERPTSGLSGLSQTHYYNLLNQGWDVDNLTDWDAGRTDMPSNCDISWSFKNASNELFDVDTVEKRKYRGNSPAPKGHFVLSVFDQDRSTASGLSVTGDNTGSNRCSCVAFFAGRLFYSGLNYTNYNSHVFFSQIIERDSQLGQCYQVNDPTSETISDLLPSDGGVVKIQEAGNIIKMIPTSFGLLLFASNGVWLISGSTGLGFTASDFTVNKISNVRTLTDSSFVEVNGSIAWWTLDGIYTLSGNTSAPTVQSLTETKIKSFYDTIPSSSKRYAAGYFNAITGVIQWLFKGTVSEDVTEVFEFDRVLILDTVTGAFYTWTISNTDVKVHSAVVVENLGGNVVIEQVVDENGDQVVDEDGNDVFIYAIEDGIVIPKFKYLVSYSSGDSYEFTWAEERDTDYVDWNSHVAEDYSSFFITGYKIHGEGIRKFQSNYLTIFVNNEDSPHFHIQSIWDYANSSETGRWSSKQYISDRLSPYSNRFHKIKIRGSGRVLQFRVSSIAGEPFRILGWAGFETINGVP